jgi:hypothetical protein
MFLLSFALRFANLLGIDPNFLKDGQVGIYELMDETSAVSFWEVSLPLFHSLPQ